MKTDTSYALTDNEYNALQKIAGATGMDCWFELEDTGNGECIIRDLESETDPHEPINFRDAIDLLNQGIVDLDFLPTTERNAYQSLLEKLDLHSLTHRQAYGFSATNL